MGTVTNHGAVALVGVKAAAKLINLDDRRRGVVSLDIVAGFAQGLLFHLTSREVLRCYFAYIHTCLSLVWRVSETCLSLVWRVAEKSTKTKLHLLPCSLSV